jgi:hypothetical protein
MSYCRWCNDDSDVHVYASCMGGIVCCHANRPEGQEEDFRADTGAAMLVHLQEHRAQGDRVPQRAIDRIYQEALAGERWSVPGGQLGYLKRKVPVGRERRALMDAYRPGGLP